MKFSFIDWAFVIGFLVLSGIIGIVARTKVSSLADYLVLGRRLRSIWGTMTLASTEMGLVTIIYFFFRGGLFERMGSHCHRGSSRGHHVADWKNRFCDQNVTRSGDNDRTGLF